MERRWGWLTLREEFNANVWMIDAARAKPDGTLQDLENKRDQLLDRMRTVIRRVVINNDSRPRVFRQAPAIGGDKSGGEKAEVSGVLRGLHTHTHTQI